MRITRRIVQSGFLALVLVGVFYVGANCERWCPFGGVEAAYTLLRTRVTALGDDRYLHPDIVAARELIASGALVESVDAALPEPLAS